MRHVVTIMLGALYSLACGGGQPAATPDDEMTPPAAEREPPSSQPEASDDGVGQPTSAAAPAPAEGSTGEGGFVLNDSTSAKDAHGATESKIKPSKTEAALKFIVVDKEKGPIEGIVIALAGPDGKKFYTKETDSTGYSEVLVPVGKKYGIVYLSLGRQEITTSVDVTDEPNQNIRLTLRYKRWEGKKKGEHERFVLSGVTFDTGKATIRPDSLPRLDGVVEFMTHKPSVRIEISGHTDNVGNPKSNKALSEKRAQACRDYLISKGIEASRIEAVGYGDERPIASNDTPEGRQQNRRIEATEL